MDEWMQTERWMNGKLSNMSMGTSRVWMPAIQLFQIYSILFRIFERVYNVGELYGVRLVSTEEKS